MISSLLIILFSLVSSAGVIALFIGKLKPQNKVLINRSRKISLSFFTFSHLFFLALGIVKLFVALSFIWLVGASFLIIASRIMNGLALYGKNNWPHYLVTSAILLSIIVLHIYKL